MADDDDRLTIVRAIRDLLVEQLIRLEDLGEMRAAADLSLAVERLNQQLGEAPSEAEIARLRRKYFSN